MPTWTDQCPDLKPENLLYLTKADDSEIVLADFGIAKHLDTPDGVLKTMAGSFGYAAPEVMLKRGHSKPVDMWSMGVITYTLLCGYSPFRSENMADLIEECKHGRVIFHERYWKDVSKEAKDFIMTLLQPTPEKRATSAVSRHGQKLKSSVLILAKEALKNPWIAGKGATDHNLLPEIRAYMAKARLRRGIEMVKLANRIESLKMQEDEEQSAPQDGDVPAHGLEAAGQQLSNALPVEGGLEVPEQGTDVTRKRSLSKLAKSGIFREVVLAKVREMKADEEAKRVTESGEVHPK